MHGRYKEAPILLNTICKLGIGCAEKDLVCKMHVADSLYIQEGKRE